MVELSNGEMILASAPGRAGVLGNPTDGYGGSVIACAICERAKVAIEPRNKGLRACSDSGCIEFGRRSDFELKGDEFDIVRAVIRYLGVFDLPATLYFSTTIPREAGLAGSTALLSSTLKAILEFVGVNYTPYYFAELNRVIELEYLGVQCGYNDAYMTTFGKLNYMDFRGKEYYRRLTQEKYATIERLTPFVSDLPFIVAHSGIRHHSGGFHRPIRDRWLEGDPKVVEGYIRIAEIARLGKRALLERDWFVFGQLMNENYSIQEEFAPSGDAVSNLVKKALKHGALGAKLAGAGGGGTVILLTLNPKETVLGLQSTDGVQCLELHPNAPGVESEILPRAIALRRLFSSEIGSEVAVTIEES